MEEVESGGRYWKAGKVLEIMGSHSGLCACASGRGGRNGVPSGSWRRRASTFRLGVRSTHGRCTVLSGFLRPGATAATRVDNERL